MAIAVTGTRLGSGATSGANRTITLGTGPTAGSTIFVSIGVGSNTVTVDRVYDARGNTYTQIGDSGNTSTAVRAYLWACLGQQNLANGDIIYVEFSANVVAAIAVDEATGLGSAHAPDQTKIGSSTTPVGSASTGASGTTAYTNELVWAILCTPTSSGTTQSITAGGSYTQQGARVTGSGISMYTEYLIVAATGAQTATATINTTNAAYAMMLVTLPDPQSPASGQRSASIVQAEVAYTGTQRGGSFVGAEVAYTTLHTAASFVGVEVAFTPAPVTRRTSPQIVG